MRLTADSLPGTRAAPTLARMEFIGMLKFPWAAAGIAAGPLTASLLARLIFGRNRVMMMLVRGSAAWMAMKILLGPLVAMAKSNLSYLIEITSK